MSKVEIPHVLRSKIGAKTSTGLHCIDVKLYGGRTIKGLMVENGMYIICPSETQNPPNELSFSSNAIFLIRPHSLLPFW